MRKLIGIVTIALLTANGMAHAAFTCEQIKEKETRKACIEDRESKESKKRAEENKPSELDGFVRSAKKALTKDFKDPAGAQYTDLTVSVNEEQFRRILCGLVNGKNSYGAYVGAKQFFVRQYAGGSMQVWLEEEYTSEDEMKKYREMCSPSDKNIVTPIDADAQ